ncbi:hypothetical protein [Coxiella burnetii]|uniref:hypothetical protein n=1 Tax=Coxiella burnetii TaxID=777 RepID=UPI0000DADFAF|nr:hypothetical protein [Coxiella burnetii]
MSRLYSPAIGEKKPEETSIHNEQQTGGLLPIGNSSAQAEVQNRSQTSEEKRMDGFVPDLQNIVFEYMDINVNQIPVPTNSDASPSSNNIAFFVHRLESLTNRILPLFLAHVAKGNQAAVEEMLEKYGALLLLNKRPG